MKDQKYKVVNGTSYHIETPEEVIKVLERCRNNGTRIRLHYGDVKTGRDWLDEYDVKGYLGRSSGSCKIPILLYNSTSIGGGAILDHCIIKITTTAGKNVLYKAKNYKKPRLTISDKSPINKDYPIAVNRAGKNVANFKSPEQANKFINQFK